MIRKQIKPQGQLMMRGIMAQAQAVRAGRGLVYNPTTAPYVLDQISGLGRLGTAKIGGKDDDEVALTPPPLVQAEVDTNWSQPFPDRGSEGGFLDSLLAAGSKVFDKLVAPAQASYQLVPQKQDEGVPTWAWVMGGALGLGLVVVLIKGSGGGGKRR